MRILRGLTSRVLACGCLAGVYETYDGGVVTIVDARGASCRNPVHQTGHPVRERADASVHDSSPASSG